MNDKELADKVVALGVGRQGHTKSADGVGFYYTPEDDCGEEDGMYSKLFVRDWRVAGALMEKVGTDSCFHINLYPKCYDVDIFDNECLHVANQRHDSSLPRAIIEACVGALE